MFCGVRCELPLLSMQTRIAVAACVPYKSTPLLKLFEILNFCVCLRIKIEYIYRYLYVMELFCYSFGYCLGLYRIIGTLPCSLIFQAVAYTGIPIEIEGFCPLRMQIWHS